MSLFRSIVLVLFVLSLMAPMGQAEDLVEIQLAEDVPVPRIVLPGRAPEAKPDEKKEGDEKKEEEDTTPRAPAEPIDPEVIRLHLLDGSILTGKLSVKEIMVDTQFGKLTIPVTNILSFRPGLNSFPELSKQINDLITNLAANDYNERESAQKELVRMGPQIRKLLEDRQKTDEDAERNRRIKIILEGYEEAVSDDEEGGQAAWIPLDTIVTTDFTVVGTIIQKKFGMTSKFGELTVSLGDVRRGERDTGAKEDIRKTITVEGSSIAQRAFKNSKIRVEAGDTITFTATGTITMTPWGSNAMSTPDGSPNYGWYMGNDVAAGALVAKIGDAGPIFKVGSSSKHVVKKSGTLFLAIGMNPSYANQAFPGKYDVKVVVKPK